MPGLPDTALGQMAAVAILLAFAWIADRLVYHLVLGGIRRVARRTRSTWDDRIVERRVLSRLVHAVPGMVVYYGLGPAIGLTPAELVLYAIFTKLFPIVSIWEIHEGREQSVAEVTERVESYLPGPAEPDHA